MTPRKMLEDRLTQLDRVDVRPWKDTSLISVSFNGKEIGHFHGEDVLDLRLSRKIIREAGLSRDLSKRVHPERSLNSIYICLEFKTDADVDKVMALVDRACAARI